MTIATIATTATIAQWQQSTVWRLQRRCVKPQRQQCQDNYVEAVALGCSSVLGGSGVDGSTAMAIFVVTLTRKRWVVEIETHAGE